MASDIDIEEHNLFENPELRVLFPDITALKQEIYNEDIEVTDIPYDQTTQKRECQLELDHSQHFDENKQRAGKKNHALQPKTCILKNKIVIGSKPKSSKTTDFSMKHNITKQVKIILSDLKPVLLNSNKFCKVCSILFPNNVCLTEHRRIIHNEQYICNKCGNNFYRKGNLTRHLKNVHKINVIQKRKTSMLAKNVQLHTTQNSIKDKNVVSNETCFHCPKKFGSKQLLIEHLYAVLEPKVNKQVNSPLNVQSIESNCIVNKRNKSITLNIQNNMDKKSCGPKQNLQRKVNNNETQLFFKCPKCYHYFKNKDFFVKHMKIKHCIKDVPIKKVPFNTKCELCTQHCSNARFYNRHIHNHQLMSLKKKQNSKLKRKSVYTKKATKKETLNEFVLKDVVFKCSKCHICFISPSLALNHAKHREYRSHWKCTECQFTFKRNEGKYHLRQHTCSKSFTAIEINEKTFSKILYSCSKCNIHFEEQQFMKHCRKCNSYPPPSEYCDICEIFIDQRLKIAHRDIHAACFMNNTDFHILKLIEKTIRKPDLVQIDSLKNNLHNLVLYYCLTCKCCVTQIHKVHLQSLCAKSIKYACRYCGLFFTNKGIMAHRRIHYKNPSIVLQDFLFYDLETGKKITPPMPDFLKCESCCKHFINRFAINNHICGEGADFICSICNMKFSEIVHKLHLPFHKYELNESNIEKLPTEEVYPLSNIQKDNVDGLVECNENAKNSIVDNDLYFCKLCFTQIYSYDKVIEHCQLHILNNRDPIKTIESHLAQDFNSKDSIDGREVYYFEPYFYGAKDDIWLKHLFNGLSLEEISKKLFHSIYRFESRIKLEISQEGNPEYTEYICMKCQCFIERSTLFSHVDGCGGHNLKSYSCGVCKNIFISQIALSQHLQIHKNLVDMKNIRIVSFNQGNDKQMNEMIKLNSSRPYYVVYRCRNCEGLVNKAEFLKHVCNIKDLKKCNNCGLLLYSSDYEYHLLKHKNLNSFTGNNIKVVLLGDLIPGFNKSPLVSTFMGIVCDYSFYKCSKCFVCVRYARCISPHFCLVDAAKAICNLCNLYFEQGKLKGHMKLHSDDPEFIKDNINTLVFNPKESMVFSKAVQPSTSSKTNVVKILEQDIVDLDDQIILYRCAKCNLHYMSKSQAKEHVKKSPGRVLKQYCTKCGIPFSPYVLFDHLKIHHKKEINTTYVVDVFGVYKKRKIFKCGRCNLHFTNAKKTSEHYLKCLGDSSNGEKCKCCSLIFHYSYLLNHEKSTDYNMHTDYEVVEVDSEFVNCKAS
ncbi:zinc finger protein Xfin isoform X1 [Pieris rapae]|uniref:zinc finger protein Xfin isoform X1 n=1 Tax=Pieris rapae TaxID=64459 RepID=UPI001E27E942|nr:zinc finger protein Xfin isoform X1 [Pieris rapae]